MTDVSPIDLVAPGDPVVAAISPPPTTGALNDVLTMTRELFFGHVDVIEQDDPEISDRFFVFRVQARGTVEDIVARHGEWHRRVVEIAPESLGLFRLSVDVR